MRNADGTGVLVGLTSIGDVHGYILDENEKVPVEGRLRYRGIDIEEIVRGRETEKRHGFHEVAYLLLFGHLPTRDQLGLFNNMVDACRDLPDGFTENMILKAPSPDIMNKLARATLASYSYDTNPDDTGIRNVLRQCIELIARFPTMVRLRPSGKAALLRKQEPLSAQAATGAHHRGKLSPHDPR